MTNPEPDVNTSVDRPPVAPEWLLLPPPSVWRRRFPLRLSIAIPVIIISLVVLTGLCEAYFIGRILKGGLLHQTDYPRLLALLQAVNVIFYLCVAGAVVIALAISHAITQPIQRLVRHAKTLATGNLTSHITIRSSDEFSVLETAFNEMATALKAYQNQMEEYNRTLEERVTARTEEMSTMLRLSKSMLHVLDQERLLKLLASGLREVTHYDLCAIALITETGTDIFLRSTGPFQPVLSQKMVDRICGEMAALAGTARPPADRIHLTVSEETEGVIGARAATDTLESVLIAPLMVGTSVTGAIALGSLQPHCFDEHLAKLLTVIVNHAALAVENAKSYARLKELDQLKSQFVTTVSHELRTPLTAVKDGVDLLYERRTEAPGAEQQEVLTAVRQNAHHLALLINDLLDLSKLEAGKTRLRKRAVALHTLAAETLARFALQADQKRLRCVCDIAPTLPALYADADKLTQVFNNLISNAIKYTPAGGAVRLTARETAEAVETCIWNAGVPLPETELERIFEKFYQVGRAPGPAIQGTGLGLTIVREILQRHGGHVWARSDPTGNSFFFTVPRFARQTYLVDCLTDLIDQARLHHAFCSLVQLRWENAGEWRSRVGPARVEELLETMAGTLSRALEQQGLADYTLRFGDEPALAVLATTNADEAAATAAKAVETLHRHPPLPETSAAPPTRWTTRIASYPQDGLTPLELLKVISAP